MTKKEKQEDKALDANTSQTEKVTTNEFKQVKVTELTLHPKLAGLYGPSDPEETGLLLQNIRLRGMLTPIKVNIANQVICGKRRLEIALRLAKHFNDERFETITVEVVKITDDEVVPYAISSNL